MITIRNQSVVNMLYKLNRGSQGIDSFEGKVTNMDSSLYQTSYKKKDQSVEIMNQQELDLQPVDLMEHSPIQGFSKMLNINLLRDMSRNSTSNKRILSLISKASKDGTEMFDEKESSQPSVSVEYMKEISYEQIKKEIQLQEPYSEEKKRPGSNMRSQILCQYEEVASVSSKKNDKNSVGRVLAQ